MTPIEEKSIATQNKLMGDILSNYSGLINAATGKGKELREHLSTKKLDEENKTVTFSKEVFDKMLDIAYILQDERKWGQMSSYADMCLDSNTIKKEILQQLK